MTPSDAALPNRMTSDEFASLVTHELRNPLNALSGWLHLLSADPSVQGDGARRALGGMRRALDQQLALIDVLGRVLRLSGGDGRPDAMQPIDPRMLLDGCAQALQPAAQAAGREIGVDVREDGAATPLGLDGDPAALGAALHTIGAYAIRHGAPGAPLRLECERDPSALHVRVRVDEGEEDGLSIWHGFGGHRARLPLELLHAALVLEAHGATVGPATNGRVGDALDIRFDAADAARANDRPVA
ncbi:MAG TPA: histidine kinase dimerization/phospho-acceptor domain-containing protein [Burkholderiaceae bacterium]|nr:histidine kinase dimerization/phospho-acceptor domain-containing protein [Burkholderiaceae bacterium]